VEVSKSCCRKRLGVVVVDAKAANSKCVEEGKRDWVWLMDRSRIVFFELGVALNQN
jgi:hypothetical protein